MSTKQKQKGSPKGKGDGARVYHPKTLMQRMAAETRRNDFRKYVGHSGIMESLSNVLLALYEEHDKPFDALEYMFDKLSSGMPIRLQLENLEEEKDHLEKKVVKLEKENEVLMQRLILYEPTAAGEYESQGDEEELEGEAKSDPEEPE